MWCLAHRLELAVKDSPKATAFEVIDELLLRLYHLHVLYMRSLQRNVASSKILLQT